MNLRLLGCLSLFTAVAACGGDDTSTPPIDAAGNPDGASIDSPTVTPDAASPDAAPSVVQEVACAGASIASTVTTLGSSYSITQASVPLNSVVQFTMPGSHNAVSGETAGTADGQFLVNFGETKCLRFTAAATYGFFCGPHQFTGSITVTP